MTGVDDDLDDGDVAYSIVTAAATSADANYNGINAADVAVTNTDNDAAGITVTPTVRPDHDRSARDGDVHRGAHHPADGGRDHRVSPSDPTEGTVSSPSLTFTPRQLEHARRPSP